MEGWKETKWKGGESKEGNILGMEAVMEGKRGRREKRKSALRGGREERRKGSRISCRSRDVPWPLTSCLLAKGRNVGVLIVITTTTTIIKHHTLSIIIFSSSLFSYTIITFISSFAFFLSFACLPYCHLRTGLFIVFVTLFIYLFLYFIGLAFFTLNPLVLVFLPQNCSVSCFF